MKLSQLKSQGIADRACGSFAALVADARALGFAPSVDYLNYKNAHRYKNSAEVDAGNVRLVVHGERIDAEPGANGYFDVQAVMCGGQDIMDLLDSKMVQLLADRAYWNGK